MTDLAVEAALRLAAPESKDTAHVEEHAAAPIFQPAPGSDSEDVTYVETQQHRRKRASLSTWWKRKDNALDLVADGEASSRRQSAGGVSAIALSSDEGSDFEEDTEDAEEGLAASEAETPKEAEPRLSFGSALLRGRKLSLDESENPAEESGIALKMTPPSTPSGGAPHSAVLASASPVRVGKRLSSEGGKSTSTTLSSWWLDKQKMPTGRTSKTMVVRLSGHKRGSMPQKKMVQPTSGSVSAASGVKRGVSITRAVATPTRSAAPRHLGDGDSSDGEEEAAEERRKDELSRFRPAPPRQSLVGSSPRRTPRTPLPRRKSKVKAPPKEWTWTDMAGDFLEYIDGLVGNCVGANRKSEKSRQERSRCGGLLPPRSGETAATRTTAADEPEPEAEQSS